MEFFDWVHLSNEARNLRTAGISLGSQSIKNLIWVAAADYGMVVYIVQFIHFVSLSNYCWYVALIGVCCWQVLHSLGPTECPDYYSSCIGPLSSSNLIWGDTLILCISFHLAKVEKLGGGAFSGLAIRASTSISWFSNTFVSRFIIDKVLDQVDSTENNIVHFSEFCKWLIERSIRVWDG